MTLTKRSFNKIINALRTRKRRGQSQTLDEAKARALDDETKSALVRFIVRHRGPVLESLVPAGFDRSWLSSCGYLYRTVGPESGYTFLHTCEHKIR